ncbi:MAG: hypothetical protein WD696_17115 [Bryobacteraceae bacterium]
MGQSNPAFLSLNYVTDNNQSQDQVFPAPVAVTLNHTVGSPSAPANLFVGGLSPIPFVVIPEEVSPESGFTSPPRPTASWLIIGAKEGLASQQVPLTVAPSSLTAGTYSTSFFVAPLARIQSPRFVSVALNLSVPPNYLQILRPPPEAFFTKGSTSPPPSKEITILTLGSATTFVAEIVYVAPPLSANVRWLDVNPKTGAGAQTLTASFVLSEINKLDRGQYLAFVKISALTGVRSLSSGNETRSSGVKISLLNDGPPNSPQFVPIILNVFPSSDFTVTTEEDPLTFTYAPGALGGVRRIGIDPVANPTLPPAALQQLNFSVSASTEDGGNWLSVSPLQLTDMTKSHTVEVRLNPQGLGGMLPDLYKAWVNINAGAATGAEIPVSLTMTQAGPPAAPRRRVFAQIVDGASWKTSIILINTDTVSPQQFKLTFRRGVRAVATNLELPPYGILSNSQIEDIIPRGGSLTLTTPGTASQLWEGWAELEAAAEVDGTAIFSLTEGPTQDSEGAVPLKALSGTRFLLPFDNSGTVGQRFDTGFAILNAGSAATAVSVTVRGEDGLPRTPQAESIQLGPLEHRAFSLPDRIPSTAGSRGVVEFISDSSDIAGLGLRFSPLRNFTSFETVASGTTDSRKLTHIADGAGWKTRIVLVNPSQGGPVNVQVRFNTGTQMTTVRSLPLVGYAYAPGSAFPVNIPASTSLTLETQGNPGDPLWTGWAEFTASGPLAGFAVFQGDRLGLRSEGAVPLLSGTSTRFFLPFDNVRGAETGLALVNPGTSVRMVFRTEAGTEVAFPDGSTSYSQALQGHAAFNLANPEYRIGGVRGVVEVTTDGQDLLGLGLRFNDPRRAFTSLPVVRR